MLSLELSTLVMKPLRVYLSCGERDMSFAAMPEEQRWLLLWFNAVQKMKQKAYFAFYCSCHAWEQACPQADRNSSEAMTNYILMFGLSSTTISETVCSQLGEGSNSDTRKPTRSSETIQRKGDVQNLQHQFLCNEIE